MALIASQLIAHPSLSQDADLAFLDDFKSQNSQAWHTAEYDFSHPHFDTDWRKSQVLFGQESTHESAGLTLLLQAKYAKKRDANRFYGGSIRRLEKTGFGRYEAWFQAGQGGGVVTGFFTYTGPAYGAQHDEIDVEILGRKPTHLHVAWFVDGTLNNRFIELGFDATEDIHHYRFDWFADQINWYVDGKLVFTHREKDSPVPHNKGFLFANIWAADPSIATWAGKTGEDTNTAAFFQGVKFTPPKPEFLSE